MPQKRLYWRLGAFDDLELALSLQLEPDLEDVKIVVRLLLDFPLLEDLRLARLELDLEFAIFSLSFEVDT